MDKVTGTFTELDLRVLDDKADWFVVLKDFWYTRGEFTYLVEANTETDLASIPKALRPFFSRTGKNIKAAVPHDHMYGMRYATRKECDKLFYLMLLDLGVAKYKAWLFWAGVRAGGWTRGRW